MEWNEMKWNEVKWNEMKWNEVEWNGVGGDKACEMKERFLFLFLFLENIVSGVPDFHPIFSV